MYSNCFYSYTGPMKGLAGMFHLLESLMIITLMLSSLPAE